MALRSAGQRNRNQAGIRATDLWHLQAAPWKSLSWNRNWPRHLPPYCGGLWRPHLGRVYPWEGVGILFHAAAAGGRKQRPIVSAIRRVARLLGLRSLSGLHETRKMR